MKWEEALVQHFTKDQLTEQGYEHVNAFVQAERSQDDELNRTVQADIPPLCHRLRADGRLLFDFPRKGPHPGRRAEGCWVRSSSIWLSLAVSQAMALAC